MSGNRGVEYLVKQTKKQRETIPKKNKGAALKVDDQGKGEKDYPLATPFLFIAKGFLLLSLLTPLILYRDLFFPFVSGKIIFFRFMVQGALFFSVAAFLLAPGREEFQLSNKWRQPIVLSVVIFALLYFFSCFWGYNVKVGLFSNFERGEGGLQMLHYLVFFILLVFLFRKPTDWRNLFVFSIIVSLLICLYGIGQYQEAKCITLAGADNLAIQACHPGTFIGAQARISGTMGNPMYLGIYLFFNLFFLVMMLLQSKKTLLKIILGGAVLVIGVVILMSQSRALFVGIVGSLLLLLPAGFVLSLMRGKMKPFLRGVIVPGLGGLGVLGGIMLAAGAMPWGARYSSMLSYTNILAALKDRLWVWKISATSMIERPFGWGPENFPAAMDKYYDPRLFGVESWFDRVHNTFLDYAITGGAPLLLAYLSIFVCLCGPILKEMKAGANDAKSMAMLFIFPFAAMAYLIQGVTSFDVVTTYLMLFLFLAYSVFFFHGDRERSEEKNSYRSSISEYLRVFRWVIPAVLLPVILAGIYWLDYLPLQKSLWLAAAVKESEWRFEKLVAERDGNFWGLFQNIASQFEPVLNHSAPVGGDESFISISHLTNRIVADIGRRGVKIPGQELLPFVDYINLEFEKKLVNRELINSRHFLDVGNLNYNAALMTGDTSYHEKSGAYIRRGLEIAPKRMEFLLAAADLAVIQGNKQQAVASINRIMVLRPDLSSETGQLMNQYERRFGEKFRLENKQLTPK